MRCLTVHGAPTYLLALIPDASSSAFEWSAGQLGGGARTLLCCSGGAATACGVLRDLTARLREEVDFRAEVSNAAALMRRLPVPGMP